MTNIKLSVCGVIIYQERFLILKRSSEDEFLPGCWEFPGGSVESNETIFQALIRELKEEIGLDITRQKSKLIGISEEFTDKNQRYLQLNYLIRLSARPDITLSTEHTAYDWANSDDPRLDSFLKNIITQVSVYLKND